ncbi:MAG: desulfoferrodoxin, partial [bacterium]|nr:desulfoferrodoxin [bacterium]
MKFYKCPVCGNIITVIEGDIDRIKCCEAEMEELKANITEAVTEKHIPVYEIKEDEITVKIGEVEHPMTE